MNNLLNILLLVLGITSFILCFVFCPILFLLLILEKIQRKKFLRYSKYVFGTVGIIDLIFIITMTILHRVVTPMTFIGAVLSFVFFYYYHSEELKMRTK